MNFVLQGAGLGVGLVLAALVILISIRLYAHRDDVAVWIYIIAICAVLYWAANFYGKGH